MTFEDGKMKFDKQMKIIFLVFLFICYVAFAWWDIYHNDEAIAQGRDSILDFTCEELASKTSITKVTKVLERRDFTNTKTTFVYTLRYIEYGQIVSRELRMKAAEEKNCTIAQMLGEE